MIDIASILQSNEHVNIEVKAAGKGIPNSIWETYSSFANTFGGAIILGIEENKDTKEFIPRGIHNPQQMLSDIWNMLNNHQKINNNILLEHHVTAPGMGIWTSSSSRFPVQIEGTSLYISARTCSKERSRGTTRGTTTVLPRK